MHFQSDMYKLQGGKNKKRKKDLRYAQRIGHCSFGQGRPLFRAQYCVVLLGSVLSTHSTFICLRGASFGDPVSFGTVEALAGDKDFDSKLQDACVRPRLLLCDIK